MTSTPAQTCILIRDAAMYSQSVQKGLSAMHCVHAEQKGTLSQARAALTGTM